MNSKLSTASQGCPVSHDTTSVEQSCTKNMSAGIRPPVVKGLPVLHSTLDIFNRPMEFFEENHKKYGEAFQVRALGKRYTVLAGADANRFMTGEGKHLFTSEKTWGTGIKRFQVIIALDGKVHKEQRDFLKPALSKSQYKTRLPELADSIEGTLENYPDGVHAAGPFMRHIVSHQLGDAMLGQEIPKPNKTEIERIIYLTNSFLSVSILGKPFLTLMKPSVFLAAMTTVKFSRKHIKAINKVKKQGASSDFVKLMLDGPVEHSGWYNKMIGLGYSLLPFFAGLDTLGATMTFAMYELVKHPDIQKRVQDEVDALFEKDTISLEAIDQMEDLMGFIYETMRLHPIAFGMNRNATEDFIFNNYQINKDEQVIVYTAANHLNEKYFPKPKTFDIERYRAPRKEHRKDGVFAPFGKGPHTCPAAGLSELQLAVNIAVLLKNYTIEAGMDLDKVKTLATPAPALSENFKIKVTRRK